MGPWNKCEMCIVTHLSWALCFAVHHIIFSRCTPSHPPCLCQNNGPIGSLSRECSHPCSSAAAHGLSVSTLAYPVSPNCQYMYCLWYWVLTGQYFDLLGVMIKWTDSLTLLPRRVTYFISYIHKLTVNPVGHLNLDHNIPSSLLTFCGVPLNPTDYFWQLCYIWLQDTRTVVEEQSLEHNSCLRTTGQCIMQTP